MRTKRIRNERDKKDITIQGNKTIGQFMGDFSVKLFDDSYYWLEQPYHQSWDSLMSVVQKIKKEVFNNGYDLFGAKHSVYLKVCGACYDADIEQAWYACIHWIRLFYNADERPGYSKRESSEFLVISDHAINRFKERVLDMHGNDIKDLIIKEIEDKVREHGDGEYYIEQVNCLALVRHNTVITILNTIESNSDVLFKGRKIA
jgi:hypothetical protein